MGGEITFDRGGLNRRLDSWPREERGFVVRRNRQVVEIEICRRHPHDPFRAILVRITNGEFEPVRIGLGSDDDELLHLLALETPERTTAAWQRAQSAFERETAQTYESARTMRKPGLLNFLTEPRNQYDPHAQIIFRLRDQDGNPIPIASTDIFFVSEQATKGTIPIQSLIENTVVSGAAPNVIVFYLRLQKFDRRARDWLDQLQSVGDFALEITAIEPAAPIHDPLISYLPLRLPLTNKQLATLIQPHRTTIIDVTLLRLPSPELYQLIKS